MGYLNFQHTHQIQWAMVFSYHDNIHFMVIGVKGGKLACEQ